MKTLHDEAARICSFLPRSTALNKVTLGYSAFNKAIYKNVIYLEDNMENINSKIDKKMKKRLASSRDFKCTADIGKKAIKYFLKHGEFPTSLEQIEPKMVEKWYVWRNDVVSRASVHKFRISNGWTLNNKDDASLLNKLFNPAWGGTSNITQYTLGEMVPSKRGVK